MHTRVKHGDGEGLSSSFNSECSVRHGGSCILWGRISFLATTLMFLECVSFCFNAIYSSAYINTGLCLGENTKFHLKSDVCGVGLWQQEFVKVPRHLGFLWKVLSCSSLMMCFRLWSCIWCKKSQESCFSPESLDLTINFCPVFIDSQNGLKGVGRQH